MRRLLPLALLGLAALLGAPAAAEDASVQATAQNTFTPGTVTIGVGDTVTWTSAGGLNHTVTSSSDNWAKDSALPTPTTSTAFTFDAPGTYTYYCKTHGSPAAGMRGAVVVRAPSTPRPTSKSPTPTRTTASPRPSSSRPTASATATAEPTTSPTPGETSGVATPALPSTPPSGGPSLSAGPRPSGPLPSLLEPTRPPHLVSIGEGGLGRPDPTGRGRGLPVALAVVALGGVVTAQFRTLLTLNR